MTIFTNHIQITRPIESIVAVYTSEHRGLCVEYEDHTGYHTLTHVIRITK